MNEQKKQKKKKQYLLAVGIFLLATIIASIFSRLELPDTNILVVYLLAVLLIVWITNSYIVGLAASTAATFIFNFFYAEPLYNFSVRDTNYSVTFLSLIVIVVATGTITTRATLAAQAAEKNEEEARALYDLNSRVTDAGEIRDIAAAAIYALSGRLRCETSCVLFTDEGKPGETVLVCDWPEDAVHTQPFRTESRDALLQRLEGDGDIFELGDHACRLVRGRENPLAVIAIPKRGLQELEESEDAMLESMMASIALAMNRVYSEEQRIRDREEMTRERTRANLLRSISHDIRTPLSGIVGSAEMLITMEERDGDEVRRDIAKGIKNDGERLRQMVDNILSLTRLQDGRIALKKEPEAAEEVIEAAVSLTARRHPDREFAVDVPGELVLVPMDARLVEQVLLNLLDNAVRHTEAGSEISVRLTTDREAGQAVFTVSDRGSGIAEADLPHIFQAFYTDAAGDSESARSMGLGLAICETVVKAHGGVISARNRTDGPGAEFTFTIPMEDQNG